MTGGIEEMMRMMLFMNMKSNNDISETLIALFSFFALQWLIANNITLVFKEYLFGVFYKCNKITIEGTKCLKNTQKTTRSDVIFSNKFKAVWSHINKTMKNNKEIRSIKEYSTSGNILDNWGEKRSNEFVDNDGDLYVVDQHKKFKLTNDIWCQVSFTNRDGQTQDKVITNMEIITIEICSYVVSLIDIINFVDEITKEYLESISDSRKNKLFIYTLEPGGKNYFDREDRHQTKLDCWGECEFSSTRTFSNIFFDQKEDLLKKIDFFRNNKDWYESEGHPHTLGLALHGPPGTGKTSVIKCIANKLKRHLIVIPLNKVKTQNDFTKYYFEDRYNSNNPKNGIDFENKIIVLDDIDCMSDLVIDRKIKTEQPNKEDDTLTTKAVFQAMTQAVKTVKTGQDMVCNLNEDDDKLTLSFILNIIDGIRETPGRILIVTSNYYDKIDAAFKRPGRIDMEIKMNNASVNTICTMFKHYYGEDYPNPKSLKNNLISPAKIVNIKLQSSTKEDFIQKIENEIKASL